MAFTNRIKKIFITLILIYVCFVAALYLIQRKMVFFTQPNAPDISAYVDDGMRAIDITLGNDTRVTSWYRAPLAGKQTLVFFHGNASNHFGNAYKAAPYLNNGYGFLSVGYPGYGGNEGKPSEKTLYQSARAWILYLINALETPPRDIVLYGESLGTGVAVQMGLEFEGLQAIILESPYTSLPDVAAKRYFFVPVHILMKDKFNSLKKVPDLKTPLLIMRGGQDTVVPPAFGQKLYDAANAPKDIIQFDAYGHNDMPLNKMAQTVEDFLSSLKISSPQE